MASTSNNAGQYDQSLLAAVPESTKQMRQVGYDPEILKTPVKKATLDNRDLESGLSSAHGGGTSEERLAAAGSGVSPTPTPRSVPFYRTKKGKIIIVVAVLVIIGAVIGGAVGGTRKKHKSSDGGVTGLGIGGNSGKVGGDAGNSGSNVGGGAPPAKEGGGGPDIGHSIASAATATKTTATTDGVQIGIPTSSTTRPAGASQPTKVVNGVGGIGSLPASIAKEAGSPLHG